MKNFLRKWWVAILLTILCWFIIFQIVAQVKFAYNMYTLQSLINYEVDK